jgi:hypothetical protein
MADMVTERLEPAAWVSESVDQQNRRELNSRTRRQLA